MKVRYPSNYDYKSGRSFLKTSPVFLGVLRIVMRRLKLDKKRAPLLWRFAHIDRFYYWRIRNLSKSLFSFVVPDGSQIIQPCDVSIFSIAEEIWTRKFYDWAIEIEEDDVIIDVGAHVGIFTLKASRRAKKGLIIAIEPNPVNYALLEYNIKNNKLRNIITVRAAVGEKNEEKVKLFLSSNNSGSHTISLDCANRVKDTIQTTSKYVEVPLITLDRLSSRYALKKIDMIKLDIEGAELDALKGGRRTLKKTKYLAIASYHYPKEAEDIVDLLHLEGFKTLVCPSGYVYAFRR